MSQNKVSYLGIGVLKAKHLSLGLKCGSYLWIGTNGSFLVGKKDFVLGNEVHGERDSDAGHEHQDPNGGRKRCQKCEKIDRLFG